MSELFYIDNSIKSKEKFDLSKFMNYENDDFDPLTSYLMNRFSELPSIGQVKIVGQSQLPDLLSYDYYETEEYWELILLYNQLTSFEDLKENDIVRLFNPSDLENTFLSLRARQQALKIASNGIISTSNVNAPSSSTGDPLIIVSATAPTNKNAVWKKTNNNNLFVWDNTRNNWLSVSVNEFIIAIGFNNVSNQYLFSSSGQNTDLIPIVIPKNISLVQSIIQSEIQSSYNILLQDFNSSATFSQINILDEYVQINNNLNIVLNSEQQIKIFLSGNNISNPKITLFYREIG